MATIRMPEHQPHQHGDIGEDYNVGTLATVAVVGLISLLWSVLWLKAIFARADHYEWQKKVAHAHYTEREDLIEGQEQRLNTPAWTDPAHGRVSRPVTEVEGQVLLDLQTGQNAVAHAGMVPSLPLGGQTPVLTSPVEPASSEAAAPKAAQAEAKPAPGEAAQQPGEAAQTNQSKPAPAAKQKGKS